MILSDVLLVALIAIAVVIGLLGPLFLSARQSSEHLLSRLPERIARFQREQAGKQLSDSAAEAFGQELAHDLPLRKTTVLEPRPMPYLPIVVAVMVILLGTTVFYTLSPRGTAVLAERQRLADPLHDFSEARQQEKQLAALQRNIRETPENSALWAALGEYYLYRNAYDNALQAYRQAIVLKGESAELYSALATVLYYQAAQVMTPPVQQMIDKALALDANEVTALMLLASDAFLRADYARAITVWQQLLDSYSPRVNRAQLIEAINTATLLKNSQR